MSRPEVVRRYNSGTAGGVDLLDCLISHYRTSIMSIKWILRMINHTVDLPVVNSWLEYQPDCKELSAPTKSPLDFMYSRIEPSESSLKCSQINSLFKPSLITYDTENSPQVSERKKEMRQPPAVQFDTVYHLPEYDLKNNPSICKKKKLQI